MGNPMYGQNKADSRVGHVTNKAQYLNLGTTTAVVLVASEMTRHAAIAGDPNGSARTVTTPTAALLVAEITSYSGNDCKVGDGFEFSFINTGTAGEDETYTMTAGSGVTVVGFADVENPATTHDAFSVGSSLWRVHVTNATSGSEAVDVIRLA